MKGLIISIVLTFALLFGFYFAVSQGHLNFPFNKESLMDLGMEKDRVKVVFKKKAVDFDELGFFETIHYYVVGGISGLATMLGTTYKLIFVLLYLLFLPLLWLVSLDRKTDFHWFKIGYLAVFIAIYLIVKKSPSAFAETIFDKCEAFMHGVASIGIPYFFVSVFFCLVFPIAMFSVVNMILNKKQEEEVRTYS